jgi:hypothetical protein
MGLIIIFVAVAAAFITLYLALAPFLASKSDQARTDLLDDEIRQVELLAAKKASLLLSLRELEFDHQTNKIADEDYERFRKRYERQAVGVMRELDAIHGGRGWKESIENEIQARLAAAGLSDEPEASVPTDSEEPISSGSDQEGANPCLGCGGPLELDDKFCSQCGTPVLEITASVSEATA